MKIVLYLIWLNLFPGFPSENSTISAVKTGNKALQTTLKAGNFPTINTLDSLTFYAEKFNRLNTQIRDGKIKPAAAQKEVSGLLFLLKRYYLRQRNPSIQPKKYFPVAGYYHSAIGGKNGNGYLPKGYNYYHGNKHTGHPAHDIFALDKDQNSLDDKTGKPIKVTSVSEGIVIATEAYWQPTSQLRGGIYVWVYNPQENLLYYYAHNQQLFVKPGDILKAGQQIATMGRSGLNAYKKRSPTHLHFMTLKVLQNGALKPVDLYQTLLKL